jgi:aspartyl protease family protein
MRKNNQLAPNASIITTICLCPVFFILFSLPSCSGCSKSGIRHAMEKRQGLHEDNPIRTDKPGKANSIKMTKQNGVYEIPIEINGIDMYFIFDTGASMISISSAEAIYLFKQDKLSSEDILRKSDFIDANGDISEGTIINLREVKVGNKTLRNIEASVVNNLRAPLLIGQSALEKFGRISIDYNKNEITFE